MEREKLAERIKFLTEKNRASYEAWKDTIESVRDNDPTGELLEAFCN